MKRTLGIFALAMALSVAGLCPCAAQTVPPAGSASSARSSDPWQVDPPAPLSTSNERVRLSIDFMGGYGYDGANATLGFERQGRVGYAILTAQGRVSPRIAFTISMNPVNETAPVPACGGAGFFYPNDPKMLFGENTDVPCSPQLGDRRVDPYRGIALDVVPQQGALREAYVDVSLTERLSMRFGRMRLPIGFQWQEAGSFTAKDAPRIQRINAQNSFGMIIAVTGPAEGRARPLYSGRLAAHLGEGNRWWDYNYFYFQDASLDANIALTFLASGTYAPIDAIEVRASLQRGRTGSKVERLPSYWACKRNDDAEVVSISLRPLSFMRVIVERASYTWGPTKTSAEMLGLDSQSIKKNGYYFTAEAWHPLNDSFTLGASITREEIDRSDSLIKRMADLGLYQIRRGERDRMTVVRAYVNVGSRLRIGFYKTMDSNPFPWLSGMTPVSGANAFTPRDTNKWGIITRLRAF